MKYYHYVCDEQGSVSHIIRGEDKENGAAVQDKDQDRVLNHYEYDVFGNTISCEERVENRFRYQIGSKTLSDDDLKIVEQTIEGENYSNLTEVVSAKEAEVYLHFLESGSTEGMTESELKAVQKIEELIKSNKIDYDGILKIRNETVKSDVEVPESVKFIFQRPLKRS